MTEEAFLDERIGYLGNGTAALAFVVLSVLFATNTKKGRTLGILVVACAATAVWASVAAVDLGLHLGIDRVVWLLDDVRIAAWLAFLLSTLLHTREAWIARRLQPALAGILCATNVAVDAAGIDRLVEFLGAIGFDIAMFGRLLIAVFGLYLTENLLRNTRSDGRFAIKFLCIGVGAMFAYDLFIHSEALLFRRFNPTLFSARGFVTAVVVPFIVVSAARNPTWSIDVFVSRQVVLHSATLIGAGLYLLLMAGAGYYLRKFGGEWGPVIQAIFLFAAVLLLAALMSSGSLRAHLKVYISKNFYNYKYDYRQEWLRFTETISTLDTTSELAHRVTQAMAGILDCPEGALWLRQDDGTLTRAASWNCRVPEGPLPVEPEFTQFLEERRWVVVIHELVQRPDRYEGLPVPGWLLELNRAWLLVPLVHHEKLTGIVILGQPRASREVNWEDFDLLKTIGRQAASYLAEQQLAHALADTRQFSEFNRRFAFVIHDIKNLVSQLSLMASNARKFKDDPRFQEDMLETVHESVDKMKRLLVRLHEGGKEAAAHTAIELGSLLRLQVEKYIKTKGRVDYHCQARNIAVVADGERLGAVIAHLLDNAFDATNGRGPVRVALSANGSQAVIEVSDDGPGMSADFIRNELFRPFRSTKKGGYGIGAYESREFVKEIGGRLEVHSEVGKGTTVRISLPAVGVRPEGSNAREAATVP